MKLSERYLEAKVYPIGCNNYITRRERIQDNIHLIAQSMRFYQEDKNDFHLEVIQLAKKDLEMLQSGKHRAKTFPLKEGI